MPQFTIGQNRLDCHFNQHCGFTIIHTYYCWFVIRLGTGFKKITKRSTWKNLKLGSRNLRKSNYQSHQNTWQRKESKKYGRSNQSKFLHFRSENFHHNDFPILFFFYSKHTGNTKRGNSEFVQCPL